jgi:hypothetical protein
MGNCLGRASKPPGAGHRLADTSSPPSSSSLNAAEQREARAKAAEARATSTANRGITPAASAGMYGGAGGGGKLSKKLAEEQARGGTSASAKDRDHQGPDRVVVRVLTCFALGSVR